MPTQLLLASENPGKLREMKSLLSILPFELVSPFDLGLTLSVVESGATYAENAALKAQAYCAASGLLAVADDSGLEVDALGGQPGIHSHRFAPQPEASDADRREVLLNKLKQKPQPWLACFRCTMAVATPHGELHFSEGICPGKIIDEERGINGFGYDPIFLLEESKMTMAELSLEEKNHLSHRSRAIRAILPVLNGLVQNHS
jgi:XTP/dITP diphosphohydrolase